MRYIQLIVATTEYTEWHSNGHFLANIVMEKLAQAVEGMGGARPPPLTISTITYKVVVYVLADRADTRPLFLLYPYMYSVIAPAYKDRKQQKESTLSTRVGLSGLLRWWPGVLNPVKQRSNWLLEKNSLFLDYKRWLLYEDPQ
jgi:hypothetical protein